VAAIAVGLLQYATGNSLPRQCSNQPASQAFSLELLDVAFAASPAGLRFRTIFEPLVPSFGIGPSSVTFLGSATS